MNNAITTKHNLDWEQADPAPGREYPRFRVGTCEGIFTSTSDCFAIISIINSQPGNGHLEDVFQWFEYACQKMGRNLLIVEIMNPRFYIHLLAKRGYIPLDLDGENVIKVFNQALYKKLLKRGNEIIIPGSLKCI